MVRKKQKTNRTSVLKDFMTAASDAVAKALQFENLQVKMKLIVILKSIQ